MIKMFVSDLDGTLLNIRHATDDRIISCIKNVIQEGYEFSVATGRNIEGIRRNKELWELPIYIVSMNGALVLDKERNVIFQKPIDSSVVDMIYETFPNQFFEYITAEKIMVNFSKEAQIKAFTERAEFKNMIANKFSIEELDSFMEQYVFDSTKEEILESTILKINCSEEDEEKYKEIDAYLESLGDRVVNAPFEASFFEVTDKSVNKAKGLEKLLGICNLSKSEVAVFGDGGNDIEMLKTFSNSFAMGNATDAAKQAASVVIKTNEEYGVMEVMESIILSQAVQA